MYLHFGKNDPQFVKNILNFPKPILILWKSDSLFSIRSSIDCSRICMWMSKAWDTSFFSNQFFFPFFVLPSLSFNFPLQTTFYILFFIIKLCSWVILLLINVSYFLFLLHYSTIKYTQNYKLKYNNILPLNEMCLNLLLAIFFLMCHLPGFNKLSGKVSPVFVLLLFIRVYALRFIDILLALLVYEVHTHTHYIP